MTKPNDLSLLSRTHGRENRLRKLSSTSVFTPVYTQAHTCKTSHDCERIDNVYQLVHLNRSSYSVLLNFYQIKKAKFFFGIV